MLIHFPCCPVEAGYTKFLTDPTYPNLKIRNLTLPNNYDLKQRGLNSLEAADDFLSGKRPPDPLDTIFNPFDGPTLDQVDQGHGSHSNAMASKGTYPHLLAACTQLTPNFISCANALSEAMILAEPKFKDLPYISLYKDVLLDRRYDQGLKLAARTLIARMRDGNITDKENLYDDVRDGFRQAGISDSDAEEMTWKTMGLIATAGPNIGMKLFDLTIPVEAKTSRIALTVLSALTPSLDLMSVQKGHIYSYPRNVKTTCENGKPYHFWLTAYLARDLAKRGYSSRAASAAAFTAQKGYEMFSTTASRFPADTLSHDPFSDYNNSIRMDLATSSAGAVFGARSVQSRERPDLIPELNIDEGLKRILFSGLDMKPLSQESALKMVEESPVAYFLRWKMLFSPDSAYEYYINHGIGLLSPFSSQAGPQSR